MDNMTNVTRIVTAVMKGTVQVNREQLHGGATNREEKSVEHHQVPRTSHKQNMANLVSQISRNHMYINDINSDQ